MCCYLGVAPPTPETRQPVVALDSLVTLVTLPRHVTLHLDTSPQIETRVKCTNNVSTHPVVGHLLVGLHGLDVGADAGGGGALHTPLVHRVLANCNKSVQILRKHWQTDFSNMFKNEKTIWNLTFNN